MRNVLVVVIVTLMAAAPATRPTSRPVRGQLVHDPLVDEAVAAVSADALVAFASHIEPELMKTLADLKKIDAAQVTRLATLREFGRYFGRVKSPSDNQKLALAWLIQQKDLAQALLMNAGEFDPPDRVLEVLRALWEADRQSAAQAPEITAALCVVWDEPSTRGDENARTDVTTPVRLLRYFSRAKLRFEPRAMPVEMLALVVDVSLSDPELAFAQQRYSSVASPGPVYFDMPYDEAAGYDTSGRPQDPNQVRTLQNMLRRGGAAIDQAYFAASVGKALGIPSLAMRGVGVTSASAPVWVTFLKNSGGGDTWDETTGRRREHDGWPGETNDPQTGDVIGDGDLEMIAQVASTRPPDRLASMALVKSADALPADKQLAAYTRAAELSPGNRAAWERLAQLASSAKLPTVQQKMVEDLYRRVLARRAGEWALTWRLRMVKDRPTNDRVAALKKIGDEFRAAPALFARARVELGDLLAEEKRRDEALAAYEEALGRSPNSGPIAVLVMGKVDPLMRKMNELQRLAEIYSRSLGMTEKIRPSAWARTTPFYLIGERYAQVLEELGDQSRAQGVRAQLENVVQLGQGAP